MAGSAIAVLICVLALMVRGLNLGIEFEGGGVWEMPAVEQVSTADIEDAAAEAGMDDARVQKLQVAMTYFECGESCRMLQAPSQ